MLLPRITITVRDENGIQFTKVSDYGEGYDFDVEYGIELVENPNFSPEDFEDDVENCEASLSGHKNNANESKGEPDFFKFNISEPPWDSLKRSQRFASTHYPLKSFDKRDEKRFKSHQRDERRFKQINRLLKRKIRLLAFCRQLQSILK